MMLNFWFSSALDLTETAHRAEQSRARPSQTEWIHLYWHSVWGRT